MAWAGRELCLPRACLNMAWAGHGLRLDLSQAGQAVGWAANVLGWHLSVLGEPSYMLAMIWTLAGLRRQWAVLVMFCAGHGLA